MPYYLSPGAYYTETDISNFAEGVNSSVVAIIGFANKGPVAGQAGDAATLVTSRANLVNTFGEPNESIQGQALEGALEILEATNSLYFVRCTDGTDVEASANVPVAMCPAIQFPGELSGMTEIGTDNDGVSAVRLTITSKDNTGTTLVDAKTYDIPRGTVAASANGGTTLKALQKILGGSLDADKIGAFGTDVTGTDSSAFIVGLGAGSGATLSATLQINEATDGGIGGDWADLKFEAGRQGLSPLMSDGVSFDTSGASVNASGGTFTDINYLTRSRYSGGGYNEGTTALGDTSGNSIDINVNGGGNNVLQFNDRGFIAETFKAGLTSSIFLEEAIGTTNITATSPNIVGYVTSASVDMAVTALPNFYDKASVLTGDTTMNVHYQSSINAAANPRFVKLLDGSYSFAGGDSGIPAAGTATNTAIIGGVESDGGKTGLEALEEDSVDCKTVIAPFNDAPQTIQNALVTKAESTGKFLAVVSPPYGVGNVQAAIDWHNGAAADRTSSLNSSYAACYWPWVKTFSSYDGKDRWYAPEIFAVRQMCETDSSVGSHGAAAGLTRGRLTKPVDVEVVLNQGDRDSLYSGGNVINPITKFDVDGIVIYGQRTTERASRVTNRVNVRRMMLDIRDIVLTSTRQFAFEPNDRFTWERIPEMINPVLSDLVAARGISSFSVTCDATTNTPLRIDRNELWCKVVIVPTRTAEVIVMEVNITNQASKVE